ncbi:MAG TPA: hypothetical protein VLE95_05200 [Chlamydiales bacterium]|nr:hypothetical protein [Chlamydiales bacterium]
MTSIHSLGSDTTNYIINEFTNPEDWENLRWVNKEFHKKVSECAEGRIAKWQQSEPPFSMPDEIAHLPPVCQVQNLYKSIADVRNHSEVKGDVLANIPTAMRLQAAFGLIRFIRLLQDIYPEREWPIIQEGNPITEAAMIRKWMEANQGALDHITMIDLSDSDISILPPEINYFSQLEYLDVSHTHITSLPEFNLQNLGALYLDDTPLISLPKAFNPQNLSLLNVSNTSISSFPEDFNPPNLRELDASDTPLLSLPKGFNPLTLWTLKLSNTHVTSLPEGFNPPHLRWSDHLKSLRQPSRCILS